MAPNKFLCSEPTDGTIFVEPQLVLGYKHLINKNVLFMQPDRPINNKEASSDFKFMLAHNFVTRCCTNNEIWKRRQVRLDAELRRLTTQLSEMSGAM